MDAMPSSSTSALAIRLRALHAASSYNETRAALVGMLEEFLMERVAALEMDKFRAVEVVDAIKIEFPPAHRRSAILDTMRARGIAMEHIVAQVKERHEGVIATCFHKSEGAYEVRFFVPKKPVVWLHCMILVVKHVDPAPIEELERLASKINRKPINLYGNLESPRTNVLGRTTKAWVDDSPNGGLVAECDLRLDPDDALELRDGHPRRAALVSSIESKEEEEMLIVLSRDCELNTSRIISLVEMS